MNHKIKPFSPNLLQVLLVSILQINMFKQNKITPFTVCSVFALKIETPQTSPDSVQIPPLLQKCS